jgi:hypothetical protein
MTDLPRKPPKSGNSLAMVGAVSQNAASGTPSEGPPPNGLPCVGSGILSNTHEIKYDLRLLDRMMREDWRIRPHKRQKIATRLVQIIETHDDPEIVALCSATLAKLDAINVQREGKLLQHLRENGRVNQPGSTFIDKQIVIEDSKPAEPELTPAVQELTAELRGLLSQCLPSESRRGEPANGNGHAT